MEGSKRQTAPGVWELRVYVGRVDGRDRQKSRTWPPKGRDGKRPKGSVSGAQKALRALIAEVEAGDHDPTPDDPGTVAELLTAWLDDRRRELQPKTVETYGILKATHIDGTDFAGLQATRVKAADLRALYRDIEARVAEASRKPLLDDKGAVIGLGPPTRDGRATARAVHKMLSSAFGEAVRSEEMLRNPCSLVRAPKSEERPALHATMGDVVAMMVAAHERDKAFAVLIRLALATGARRGELVALRWGDVRGTEVRISRALTQVAGEILVKKPKNGKTRIIHVDASTAQVLADWKRECATEALKLGEILNSSWYMWTTTHDGTAPWRPDAVTLRWDRLRRRVGVNMRWHDIRHVTGSFMTSERVGLAEAAQRQGHSKEVLVETYSHADEERSKVIAELVGGAIEVEVKKAAG